MKRPRHASAAPAFEFKHLRAFVALVEAENFTKAATSLGIAQPTMSLQIKELERLLGVILLERNRGEFKPTEAGHVFYEQARVLLQLHGEAADSVREDTVRHRHVDLAVMPYLTGGIIPAVLPRFFEKRPGCRVRIYEMSTRQMEREITHGHLDAGIGLHSHASAEVEYDLLKTAEFVVVLAEDHPFAKKKKIDFSTLATLDFALPPPSFDIRNLLDRALRKVGVLSPPTAEIDSTEAILDFVSRSQVATLLPPVTLMHRRLTGLVTIPITPPIPIKFECAVLWQKDHPRNPAAVEMVEIAAQLFKSADS